MIYPVSPVPVPIRDVPSLHLLHTARLQWTVGSGFPQCVVRRPSTLQANLLVIQLLMQLALSPRHDSSGEVCRLAA